jgi:hypothetical protein
MFDTMAPVRLVRCPPPCAHFAALPYHCKAYQPRHRSIMLISARKPLCCLTFLWCAVEFVVNSPAQAQVATIGFVGCGTGCVQKVHQLGPVSRTSYGFPKVPVSITTILQPGPGTPLLGHSKSGDPIVKWQGSAYPKIEKFWVVADYPGKRVGLYAKDSDGADAIWGPAFIDGEPNNCHSACGRRYDQWRLLCKAAGLL